jgi:tRNA1(Val) A37 N6-methylase TrmN6
MIEINYLLGYENLKIVQDKEKFNFSLDSVLLPNFVTINPTTRKILDIGCGNAPGPLILSTRTNADIIGVEIQSDVYKLALESVKINNLENQIQIINSDIKKFAKTQNPCSYDVIICNPPFFKKCDNSILNNSYSKSLARHEISLNLDDVFRISKKLLKTNGIVSIVHRPERLIEIIDIMKKYNIEPKRVQLIYPNEQKNANILLIEGRNNGNVGLKVLPPIFAHNLDGSYTEQINKFFMNGGNL